MGRGVSDGTCIERGRSGGRRISGRVKGRFNGLKDKRGGGNGSIERGRGIMGKGSEGTLERGGKGNR